MMRPAHLLELCVGRADVDQDLDVVYAVADGAAEVDDGHGHHPDVGEKVVLACGHGSCQRRPCANAYPSLPYRVIYSTGALARALAHWPTGLWGL
jgi:hypothetical protein